MSTSETVRIDVAANRSLGALRPIWSWFGYDEPNYSYLPYGRKLLGDIAKLHAAPVHVRVHNLLTSGDGTPALKWGSTGVYDEVNGTVRYSWAILDRIFDAYVEAGVTPFVQLGFMPEALSSGPPPYRHDFPRTPITTGWAYPPKDHAKWAGLVEAVAAHMVARYGLERAQSWPWELWNEPDGLYWRGSVEEFCRLHDVTSVALRRVLPSVRFGGPHTCGPFSTKGGAPFLRRFLEHCSRAVQAGERPLDFVAFHAKGRPSLVEGRVRMGLASQLNDIATGLAIVGEFADMRDLPVILGESDPEGCAACPASTHPENAYRDGPLYGAYVAEALFRTWELSERAGIPIEGSVTWAFEFEGEPFFAGYRELATNGIAKPVLNVFRMFGMLGGERVAATSSGALALDHILAEGVRGRADVNVLASRGLGEIAVLVWHYHDDDRPDAAPAPVELVVSGLPGDLVRCAHFRMDAQTSNAHAAWLAMGSPQPPGPRDHAALDRASRLALLEPEREIAVSDGTAKIAFSLPPQGVSLLRLRS